METFRDPWLYVAIVAVVFVAMSVAAVVSIVLGSAAVGTVLGFAGGGIGVYLIIKWMRRRHPDDDWSW